VDFVRRRQEKMANYAFQTMNFLLKINHLTSSHFQIAQWIKKQARYRRGTVEAGCLMKQRLFCNLPAPWVCDGVGTKKPALLICSAGFGYVS